MSDIEKAVAEHACARLCTEFHVLVDRYEHDKILDLFAPDAIWHHRTGKLTGREEMATYLDSKSTYPLVRHVVTNILIKADVEAGKASGTCYVTVYYGEANANGVAAAQGPALVVDYEDTFVNTADGWRFATRRPCIKIETPEFGRMIHSKEDERRLRGQD